MRRFLLFALAATLFGACTQDVIDEQRNVITDDNRTLTVSLDGDANDTRIQLNEEKKSVWTEGDLLSVFYRSTTNEQWQFAGKTGDRSGNILPVDNSVVPTPTTNDIVVVYPYNAGYFYNSDTKNVQASLPAEQSYLKDSYGLDGNIMVSQSEYNQVSLKSVCGWLKLQLTGAGETVKSITLRGNAGEQVAGELYINTADATSTLASELTESGDDGEVGGTLVHPGTILTEVTLNCGEGVALGAETTAFYIALPPQTFTKGIMVEVNCNEDVQYCKYTTNSITIERNTIQPLSVINTQEDMDVMDPNLPPYNEIWYTSTTGTVVHPISKNGFGANLISNTYEDGKGILKFDGIVTAIGAYAYNSDDSPNRTLESVTMPLSVTSIGELAFRYCTELKDINLHDGITHIGERAFIYTGLTEITIPKGLTELSKQVFDSTPIKSIIIPDNIKIIRERAFCLCDNLETIVIGDGVTDIELCAFETWRPATVSVTLGKNVTTMGDNVFDGCTGTLTITGNIPYTPSSYYNCNGWLYGADFTEIVVADSVETIPDNAFNFPYNSLQKVSIGTGVKSIGKNIFANAIPEIHIKDINTWLQIEHIDAILNGTDLYINGQSAYTITIPEGVTRIPSYTFSGCKNITFIVLPSSVTTIGESAFYDCPELISVNQAQSLTTIENNAFRYCKNLIAVDGPYKLTNVGDYAFQDCENLRMQASNLNSLETIGESAFSNCKNLTSYLSLPKATSIGEKAFYYCASITGTVDISSATTIGAKAFYYCSNMSGVLLNDNLTKIEAYTFSDTGLKNITLPNALKSIGEYAFSDSKLESVTIPENVTYIDCYAFEYNRNLTTVYCYPIVPPSVGTEYDDGDRYWSAFVGHAENFTIYVPQGSLNAYQTKAYWSNYKNYMVEIKQ